MNVCKLLFKISHTYMGILFIMNIKSLALVYLLAYGLKMSINGSRSINILNVNFKVATGSLFGLF